MKLVIDFDDPDPLPLKDMLRMIWRARILYEVDKLDNQAAAARRLGISREAVWRAVWWSGRRRRRYTFAG